MFQALLVLEISALIQTETQRERNMAKLYNVFMRFVGSVTHPTVCYIHWHTISITFFRIFNGFSGEWNVSHNLSEFIYVFIYAFNAFLNGFPFWFFTSKWAREWGIPRLPRPFLAPLQLWNTRHGKSFIWRCLIALTGRCWLGNSSALSVYNIMQYVGKFS